MATIKYSVIIPHKNIPDLLLRCLASIPKRADVEIIIVDNNSDPKIVDFNNFPGLGSDGVKVVLANEGKGAGYAKNVGIDNAQGEWLLFADADDFYITENLNRLLNINIPDDCDVVVWRYVTIDFNGKQKSSSQKVLESGQEFVKCYDVMYPYMFCAPYNKMVRADFIKRNRIRYDEVISAGDIMFAAKLSVAISHYYFYNADCYYYVKRRNSVMETNTIENMLSRHEAAIRVNEFLLRSGKNVRFDGGYGNWLAQINYPVFFKAFCKDIKQHGFRSAYRRYSIICCEYPKISRIPFFTCLKRKIKAFYYK